MDNCRKCRVTRLKLRARPPFFICLLCCGVSVTCSDIHTIDDSTLTLASTCGDICRYEDFFQRAHCDERKMTFIPISTGCENATLLELQRNSITKITSDEMFGFKNVRTLDLSQTVKMVFQLLFLVLSSIIPSLEISLCPITGYLVFLVRLF